MKTNHWGSGVLILLAAVFLGMSAAAVAQQQSKPSVAEAARRAREEKQKKPQAKADKVYTNDNVPKAPDFSIGPGPAAAGESGAAAAAGGEVDTAALAQDRDKAQADLQAREERLARLKTELNLLERDYSLNREQVTSTSGATTTAAGRAALSTQETEIATKRADIQTLEQEIASLKQRVGSLTEAAPVTKAPPTPEQLRKEWTDKLAPLRQQLADVEAELSSMRAETGQTGDPRMPAGSFTADRIRQLETRRTELQRQISDVEADARRAGVRPQ